MIATPPIGEGVDANAFDPSSSLAFASNGEGTLTVVHEDSPDKFSVLENVTTKKSARTMALDPQTHGVDPPWETREIEPVPGRLVLFPSYVPHATQPSGLEGERISIAFDVVPTKP